MMTNLLPPEIKKELFFEEIQKLVLICCILICIFLISLALILFGIKTYLAMRLNFYQNSVSTKEQQLKIQEVREFKAKIESANENLEKLNSFYQEQIELTVIFEKISKFLSPSMYLTNLAYQKETKEIQLSGFAPQSKDLLEFQKKLEKEFPDSYFPLQNWIKTTDINFQASFKIP
jgi:Tfp pilus assembly protein PilN